MCSCCWSPPKTDTVAVEIAPRPRYPDLVRDEKPQGEVRTPSGLYRAYVAPAIPYLRGALAIAILVHLFTDYKVLARPIAWALRWWTSLVSFASWATEGARSSALLPLVQWTKDKLDKATATQRVWYMVLVLVAYFVYSRWGEIQYTVMDLVKGGKRKIF